MSGITKSIKILNVTRQNYIKITKDYDLDALNYIPPKFNNNLIWNFGHIIATHQLLCYKLSGVQMYMDKTLIKKYVKGTKPEQKVTKTEVEELSGLALDLADKFASDFENGIFKSYNPYQTSYGITLESIKEAAEFNNVHEGMHLGACIAIKKFLD